MTFQHVQPCCGLQIVHDDRAFARPDCQSLRGAMKVDCRVRLNDMAEDFCGRVKHRFTTSIGVGVKRFDNRLDEAWQIAKESQWFLRVRSCKSQSAK